MSASVLVARVPCLAAFHRPASFISDSNWEENQHLESVMGAGRRVAAQSPSIPGAGVLRLAQSLPGRGQPPGGSAPVSTCPHIAG